MKQLRMQKGCMNNEIVDLREAEGKRIAMAKQARLQSIHKDAEMADGGVEYVSNNMEGATYEEKKATLIAIYKADLRVLSEADRKEPQEKRAALKKDDKEEQSRANKRPRTSDTSASNDEAL